MRQVPHTEYAGYRGVGVRLMEPMVPDYSLSEGHEDPLRKGFHWFDKAHTLMLGEENLIPAHAAASILKAFRDMESEGVVEVRTKHGWGTHSGEQYLIRKLGYDIGGRIHLGRSSGDLQAVSQRVAARDCISGP